MLQSVVARAVVFIFSLSFRVRRTAVDPLGDDVRSALKTDVARYLPSCSNCDAPYTPWEIGHVA